MTYNNRPELHEIARRLEARRRRRTINGVITSALVAIAFAVFIVAVIAITPLVLMWAWNYLATSLFDAPTITFWQSFAIVIVLGVLRTALSSRTSRGD